jgi:hypothetical protein
MIVDVSKISEVISSSKEELIIIGQPKSVGLTTQMVIYFCDLLFFEEDCSILIICDDGKTKNYIVNLAQDILKENYDYNAQYDYDNNFFKVYNNVFSVISYKKYDKSNFTTEKENFKYKIAYVDKDDNNHLLNYYITTYLPAFSEKMIVATYDTPTSLYYINEVKDKIKKVIVRSEKYDQNIKELLFNQEVYTLEYETIIKGEFKNEI